MTNNNSSKLSMNFQVSSIIDNIICDYGKVTNTNKSYIEVAQVVEIEHGYLFIQYTLISENNQSFNDLIEDYKKMDHLNLNASKIELIHLNFYFEEDHATYEIDNLKDYGYYTAETVVSEYNDTFN